MPKKKYHLPNETIILTDDFIEFDATYSISPNEREIINDLFAGLEKKNLETTKLKSLVKNYPENVVFKSLLAINYLSENKDLLAYNIAIVVLEKYPEFLLAKQALITYFAKQNNFASIDSLFNDFIGCGILLPERKTITYFEYLLYVMAAVEYGFVIEDIDFVEEIADTLKVIEPLDYAYKQILLQLEFAGLEEELFEEDEYIYQIESNIDIPGNLEAKAPEFENPEVLLFYKNEFKPDSQTIRKFLLLPKESFIRDLIKVLHDLENRFIYFQSNKYQGGKNMLFHVCNFIEALEAEEAIPDILLFLKNDETFLLSWIYPNMFSDLWSTLTVAGRNRLEEYVEFLFEPGLEAASKELILNAIYQIQLHYPNKYKEVAESYLKIINRLNSNPLQQNVFDDNLLFVICEDALELGYTELTQAAEQFYHDPRFKPVFKYSFDHLLKSAKDEANRNNTFDKKNIYLQYGDFPESEDEFDWMDSFDEDEVEEIPESDISQQPLYKKIGRNEPCPCGSGKKFKHCHGKFPDIITN